MVRLAPGTLRRWAAALVLGGLVGAVGTVLHRAYVPWGIGAGLALVLASGVLVRAWAWLPGLLAYGVGWVVVVQILSLTGPGGDVLIPAHQAIGYAWIVGGMLMMAVAAFAPARWFRDDAPARAVTPETGA